VTSPEGQFYRLELSNNAPRRPAPCPINHTRQSLLTLVVNTLLRFLSRGAQVGGRSWRCLCA
jgi:hypothetical protein